MYNSRCNCSSNSGRGSSCARNGERILVNQSGCNTESRSRCSCVNTYRPGCGGNHGSCGCHHHDNDCGCGSNGNSHGCGCGNHRPCPPRPVSYTHLDVYKRQESRPPDIPIISCVQLIFFNRCASPAACICKICIQRLLRCASSPGTNG